MSETKIYDPSVDIDPIPTGAGGIVRGATITITGKAKCMTDTEVGDRQPKDTPEDIRKVEVRLGASGAFVKGRPTGAVSHTTQQKRSPTWTVGPLTITGVANDAYQIAAQDVREADGGGIKADARSISQCSN